MQEGKRISNGEFYGESMESQGREKAVSALFFHPMQTKNQQPHFCKLLIIRAENGNRTLGFFPLCINMLRRSLVFQVTDK